MFSDVPNFLWDSPYEPENLHKTLHSFHLLEELLFVIKYLRKSRPTQNPVPQGVWVRFPPPAPAIEWLHHSREDLLTVLQLPYAWLGELVSALFLRDDIFRRPMNVRYAPLAVEATEQHCFDGATVDGPSAIGSQDGFDAQDPRGIACFAM